jgi:hypothetical protein
MNFRDLSKFKLDTATFSKNNHPSFLGGGFFSILLLGPRSQLTVPVFFEISLTTLSLLLFSPDLSILISLLNVATPYHPETFAISTILLSISRFFIDSSAQTCFT